MILIKLSDRFMSCALIASITYIAVAVLLPHLTISPIATIERMIAPGYGHCLRCERPWKFVEEHITEYHDGRGMFPLCERCWSELGTPEKRLPYYRELWYRWEESTPGHADWNKIEKAVMAGG